MGRTRARYLWQQLDDYADVGVTWLLVQVLTVADAQTRIAFGPPA